jgi:putative transposase
MYLTQKNQIRNLNSKEYTALKELCRLSKNLYNVGLYTVRQYYFQERKHLRYESNYHTCKKNENYKLLNTDIAQQTLKVVDRTFRSFYALINLVKEGTYTNKVKLPYYLPKDGYFCLIIPRIKIKDGKFKVPMSHTFRKQFGEIWLDFPTNLDEKKIKEVRIHPKYNGKFFEIEFVSETEITPVETIADNAIAIDLGLDNLATCVDTLGASFIVDGKRLKSINQWYNKQNSLLQSQKDKQGIKTITNKQAKIIQNRNYQVRDYLNKTARYIINHCIKHKIKTVIIGVNPTWKQDINLGKQTNQNFVQIPFWSLRLKIKSLCERYELTYQEQEESYTSKASFLDNDDIPVWNADNPKEYKFSGKRIKRGLYRTKDKKIINADANGAVNIGKKSKHNGFKPECLVAALVQPLRVKIS